MEVPSSRTECSSQGNRVVRTAPSWQEQTALITGAASGLGLAITHRLAALGARVLLMDLRSETLEAAVASVGGTTEPLLCDVTDLATVTTAVAAAEQRYGPLSILVNCAGITGATNVRSHETDPADVERVFRVNFYGTYHTCRAVLPDMMAAGYGRILNIASIAGKEGNAGMLAYSASKAAVIGLTKVMGKEYAETGVTINALAPAVIQTPLVDAMPDEQVRYMTDKIPMKRCGTLEELAATACFIISPEASFTTGFTYDLSGGRATY